MIIQEEVDEALVNLETMNKRGEQVSVDILNPFTDEEVMFWDIALKDLIKLIELLDDNLIEFDEEPRNKGFLSRGYPMDDRTEWGACERISYLIKSIFYLDLKNTDDLAFSPQQLNEFYHKLISLWDRTWIPVFEGRIIHDYQLEWIAYGFVIEHPDAAVIDHLVQVLKSRLPTTDEAWEIFKTENPKTFLFLRAIDRSLEENTTYWDYYLSCQAIEHFGAEDELPQDWSVELFDSPILSSNLSAIEQGTVSSLRASK